MVKIKVVERQTTAFDETYRFEMISNQCRKHAIEWIEAKKIEALQTGPLNQKNGIEVSQGIIETAFQQYRSEFRLEIKKFTWIHIGEKWINDTIDSVRRDFIHNQRPNLLEKLTLNS